MSSVTLAQKISTCDKDYIESVKFDDDLLHEVMDLYSQQDSQGFIDLTKAIHNRFEKLYPECFENTFEAFKIALITLETCAWKSDEILFSPGEIGKIQEFYRKSIFKIDYLNPN